MEFEAGQRWTYRTPPGFESSRIVIGAVVRFEDGGQAVCIAVAGAPARCPGGGVEAVTIPFLPFSHAALTATVVALDGTDAPPGEFQSAMAAWAADARGLSTFTVPFEGQLDRLIAMQMAAIAADRVPATP